MKKKNFLKLSAKTVHAGERKIAKYLSAERWIAMLQADDAVLQELFAAWDRLVAPAEPVERPSPTEPPVPLPAGIVLSAEEMSDLLKIRVGNKKLAVPNPIPGEVIAYCDDWLLTEVRDSPAGKKHMQQCDWFERYQWRAKAGYHRLLLPVPGSNDMMWSEQAGNKKKSLLVRSFPGWNPAPITIATSVVVAWLMRTGQDLLKDVVVRCLEQTEDSGHALLDVHGGSVRIMDLFDYHRYDAWYLAAAREAS